MGFFDSIKSMFGLGGASPAEAPAPVMRAADDGESADDSDNADDSDDGDRRDYEMEAQDDSASFDLENDLEGFFAAEFHVQQAWEQPAKLAQVFARYGVRDAQHWRQVEETAKRYQFSPRAQQKYGGMGEIMHVKGKVTQDLFMAQLASTSNPKDLEPFEGVTLQAWASAQASIASGKNTAEAIRAIGCDQVKWDRVGAEWLARMSRDTSGTVARVYGEAFTQNAGGQFGGSGTGVGAPPISLEKYVEVMEAQSAAALQGRDASQVLASFGLSVVDWSNAGGWWSKHLNENMMKNNNKLFDEYNALQKKYEAKYKTQSADSDITF